MALAPLHQCQRCRKLVRGKCLACAKETNKRKPSKNNDFYQSQAWKKLRNQFIAEHPLCEPCALLGRTEPARIIDHRIEIEDDPTLALDWENLAPMCLRCHNTKSAKERARRQREKRENGGYGSGAR